MANLINEGFDWFPSGQSAATRERLWGANEFFDHIDPTLPMTPADVAAGRFGFGHAFAFSGDVRGNPKPAQGYVIPIGATPGIGFWGGALFVNSGLGSNNRPCIGFYDAVNDVFQCFVTFEVNGVIKVWSNTTGETNAGLATPLATSVAGVFQEDQWFHVEMKATIANSGGGIEVRINTVPKLQLVGADTQQSANTYFDSVFIGAAGKTAPGGIPSTTPVLIDDLFVNDTTGAENNDWSGNLRVKTQFVIANGATDNFTIGGSVPAATHWQSVLNQLLDDTKYEFSPTIGDIDLFTPDPNLNAPLVRALQVRMALRQDDATQRTARAILQIGGTNYLGVVDQFTNQTYTFYKERWELNPATGVTFTGADVNGLQAGVKVQA